MLAFAPNLNKIVSNFSSLYLPLSPLTLSFVPFISWFQTKTSKTAKRAPPKSKAATISVGGHKHVNQNFSEFYSHFCHNPDDKLYISE